MSEAVDESSMNALQLYTQNYKQADLTLTGTARKANLVDQRGAAERGPGKVERGRRWSAKAERGHRWSRRKKVGGTQLLTIQNAHR